LADFSFSAVELGGTLDDVQVCISGTSKFFVRAARTAFAGLRIARTVINAAHSGHSGGTCIVVV
jgi:hypothetical protein